MSLVSSVTDIWKRFQGELFPMLAEEVGELQTKHRRLVAVLDVVGVEGFVGVRSGGSGRPSEDRTALVRAFIAKAVWDFPTTRDLMDRLACDPVLRRLCGWSRVVGIPGESTFSRAFGEFAWSRLPERMHEGVVKAAFEETIVGHISRDSTAIEAREKPRAKVKGETAAAAVAHGARGDARRVAQGPGGWLEEKREGFCRDLEGLQAARGRRRPGGPHQLPVDLGLPARQPGGHPPGDPEHRTGEQPDQGFLRRASRPRAGP